MIGDVIGAWEAEGWSGSHDVALKGVALHVISVERTRLHEDDLQLDYR